MFAMSLSLGGKDLALLAFVWMCDLLKILKIYSHLVFPPEIPQMHGWRETDSMEKSPQGHVLLGQRVERANAACLAQKSACCQNKTLV